MNFGEFIMNKRKEKGITLRAFAEKMDIAPSYMSDIEKSKRNAPSQDILDRMADILEMSEDEKNIMMDLAAQSKSMLAQDLTEYVSVNANVRVALRKAKDLNLGDDEWIKIIERMIKDKK